MGYILIGDIYVYIYIYINIYKYIGASERFQNRGGHDFVLDIFFAPQQTVISA